VPPEFYTPQDIADAMKLAYRTVLEHIRRGHLRTSGCGLDGRAPYRIHPDDFEAWRVWLTERPAMPAGALVAADIEPPAARARRQTHASGATKAARPGPPKVRRSAKTGRRVVELVSARP
jgi:Helix-turn-helix domain